MGYKVRRGKTAPGDQMSREVAVYLPKSLYDYLKAKSTVLKMPMSRLVAWAVDNEITEGDGAFAYSHSLPTTVYVEGAYVDEGGLIYQYLMRNGTPLSIDQLVLARREVGIPDKVKLLLGIRELIERETLVELIYPSWSHFNFGDDYRVIAIKTSEEDRKKKAIAKLEEQLIKLKGQQDGGPFGKKAHDTPQTEE